MAENGGGNGEARATTEIVRAEVREVKAIIQGHAELTAEKLNGINEKIGPLVELPGKVARLEERQQNCESHIGRIWAHLDTAQADETSDLRARNVELSTRARTWLLGVGLPVGLVLLGWVLQHGF